MLQKMSISYILSLVLYSHHARDMAKSIHKAHSSWQTFFSIAFFVVLLMVAATVFYRIKIASMENKIADISMTTKEVEKKIAEIEKEPGYNKLGLVRKLLADGNYMPRSRHIPILIDMLLDLQKVDTNSRDKIELYDFRISLEEIELKGMVSRLLLLYYSSPER